MQNASDEQVIAAAKVAYAHDFHHESCSSVADTILGAQGLNLSGGQRQRIAIAESNSERFANSNFR